MMPIYPLVFLVVLFFNACTFLPLSSNISVEIIVTTPQVVNTEEQVRITGNHDLLSNWSPSGIPLERIDDHIWVRTFTFPRGTDLEYKFTRGTWQQEALFDDCQPGDNFRLAVHHHVKIKHDILLWLDECPPQAGEITGDIEYHRDFKSEFLELSRDVLVWLPPEYSESHDNYPVLYMHDGQNIVDPTTSFTGVDWQVDEVTTQLVAEGRMRPVIIVGINNTKLRRPEYSPVHLGEEYTRFIIEELMPFINVHYRTLEGPENTAVMGSSMGGIISFHIAWENPDVFGLAGCLSPAFMVDDNEILHRVRNDEGPRKSIKFYLDNGTVGLEKELEPAFREMAEILRLKGYMDGEDLLVLVDDGAEHNEAAWAQRIHEPLLFFFGLN